MRDGTQKPEWTKSLKTSGAVSAGNDDHSFSGGVLEMILEVALFHRRGASRRLSF